MSIRVGQDICNIHNQEFIFRILKNLYKLVRKIKIMKCFKYTMFLNKHIMEKDIQIVNRSTKGPKLMNGQEELIHNGITLHKPNWPNYIAQQYPNSVNDLKK